MKHPCGSSAASSTTAQQCCAENDSCLSNSICYIAGCTQESFQGPKCSKQCSDYPTQDIIYNSTTGLWHCCYGSGTLDCSFPSPDSFQAPSPEQLLDDVLSSSSLYLPSSSTISSSSSVPVTMTFASFAPTGFSASAPLFTLLSSILSVSIVSSTSLGSPSHLSSPAYSPHNITSGLSTHAAKAGIGIAGALAGLALATLTLTIARRRRNFLVCKNHILEKKPIADVHCDNGTLASYTEGPHLAAVELNAERVMELDSNAKVELDAVKGRRI